MAIYDGNQLPESPTSMFQMVVSVMYTLLVFLLMSYGATAVLAAQETISTEMQATEYMERLVRKHNAVVRGMIAFIPATFSLGHLYTSSMHNGSLYTASNVFYVAIFAFATRYLGDALQQIGADSGHMDATKALYETLYFLTRCCAKLSTGPRPLLPCMRDKDAGNTFATKACKSPWVMYNCFLSIAALDDSRVWGQFIACWRRHRKPSSLDFLPAPTSNNLKSIYSRMLISCGRYPRDCTGYAYWLFSQDAHVYNYTGSVIVEQSIPEKLSIASYSTKVMYPAAQCFLKELSTHFQRAVRDVNMNFSISAGNATVEFSRLQECLNHVKFENQGLNMAVERYICRCTPDYGAFDESLPVSQVKDDILKWAAALYDNQSLVALNAVKRVALVLEETDANFYCTLWLAYMHMVLLGVDLLRMHNNKAAFAEYKQHQAGFFEILGDLPASSRSSSNSQCGGGANSNAALLTIKAAADHTVSATREPPEQLAYPELHELSGDDLHGVAAILATLLLMRTLLGEDRFAEVATSAVKNVTIQWEPNLEVAGDRDSYLRKRLQLITKHSSLPGIVKGVECRTPSGWVRSLLLPLGCIISCVAVVAVTFATISCSNGVFLVAISGLVQAYFAWALLLLLEQLPCVTEDVPDCWQLALVLICPAISILELVWELFLQVCYTCKCNCWCGSKLHQLQQQRQRHQQQQQELQREQQRRQQELQREQQRQQEDLQQRQQVQQERLQREQQRQQQQQQLEHQQQQQQQQQQQRQLLQHQQQQQLLQQQLLQQRQQQQLIQQQRQHLLQQEQQQKQQRHQQEMQQEQELQNHEQHEDQRDILIHVTWAPTQPALYWLQLLNPSGPLSVSLGSCFNQACRRLYKHRISLSDWLVHASTLAMVLLFLVFIFLARFNEPWYAKGIGMCIGRCSGRSDCWNNITLELPIFDNTPSCPGEGRLGGANNLDYYHIEYHQCPAMQMVLNVSDISLDNKTLTPGSSTLNTLQLAGGEPGAASSAPDMQQRDTAISTSSSVPSPAIDAFTSLSPSPRSSTTTTGIRKSPQPRTGSELSIVSQNLDGQELAGTTACTATVRLVDAETGVAAKEGLTVAAGWHTMSGNTLDHEGGPLQNATSTSTVTAKTSSQGKAIFISPPIKSNRGCGCNITIQQPSDGTYQVNDRSNVTNSTTW